MPSTYSPLKIQLMATGENSTTWGDITNTNLGTAMEEAITGSANVAFSNANVTLTLTDTNASQVARNLRLNLTGTATAGYSLILGSGCQIEKPYIINNGTDGVITVKNTTGTGVAVAAGTSQWVYNNGVNVVDVISGAAGTLAVANGGTGATTAAGAATNLGLGTASNVQHNSLGVGTAGSATAGEIRATNNVTAFYSSDATLKENVHPIQNALGIVSSVGGKTFDWTDAYIAEHGGEDGYFVTKSDFGVIAQDVQAVFPLAVRTRTDGTLAVDYEKLVAVAFQAIAELRAEVEALKK
jgi:hypothetical protein